jgi:hypothetical protein
LFAKEKKGNVANGYQIQSTMKKKSANDDDMERDGLDYQIGDDVHGAMTATAAIKAVAVVSNGQQQQRVSRLGKAVLDASQADTEPNKQREQKQQQQRTIMQKEKKANTTTNNNKKNEQQRKRLDSRVLTTGIAASSQKQQLSQQQRKGKESTPNRQPSQQRVPAPRRPGGIDASMLGSPHRVTSPDRFYATQSPVRTQAQLQQQQQQQQQREVQVQQRKELALVVVPKPVEDIRNRVALPPNEQQLRTQLQLEQRKQQQPSSSLPRQLQQAPKQPQPASRQLQLVTQPLRLGTLDESGGEKVSLKDIMTKKAKDERKQEMRARKEKRKRDEQKMLALPSPDDEDDDDDDDNGGLATLALTASLNDSDDGTDDEDTGGGRRTRQKKAGVQQKRSSKQMSLDQAAATAATATAVVVAADKNLKMTTKKTKKGAPEQTLLKSALKKSSQIANNSLALALPASQQSQNVHTPRVKIVDGQIVVDQATLTVQASHENRIAEGDFTRKTEERSMINSQTYSTRSKPTKWKKEDTELFYKAIEQFGTDFTLIQSLFPGRTRRQVKSKYMLEQKANDERITSCMNNTNRDNAACQSLIAVLQSDKSNRVEVIAGKGLDRIVFEKNNIAAQVLNGDAPMEQENVEVADKVAKIVMAKTAVAAAASAPLIPGTK